LSTQNSQLWIGEHFNAEELQHRLYANAKQPLLLYPDTPDEKSLGLLTPAPLPERAQLLPEQLRLVVIDATWRKSRKMLYINQALQQLPRFALINPPATIYKIRKADSENQLSTLEASCYALQQLEPDCDYQPLLQSFRQFIDQFASYLPSSSPTQRNIEEL
jgi:DTW domain-containing protein YfiP